MGKYFTLNELTRSATAARKGINNSPSALIKSNLEAIIEKVLDPLREKWGKPIIVTSGYRCPKLNTIIGGAPGSQHMKGEAVDIRTATDTRDENMKLLKILLKSDIVYDQVISEYVDAQGRPDWIHISYKKNGGNRMKKTTCLNGKYTSGIRI